MSQCINIIFSMKTAQHWRYNDTLNWMVQRLECGVGGTPVLCGFSRVSDGRLFKKLNDKCACLKKQMQLQNFHHQSWCNSSNLTHPFTQWIRISSNTKFKAHVTGVGHLGAKPRLHFWQVAILCQGHRDKQPSLVSSMNSLELWITLRY